MVLQHVNHLCGMFDFKIDNDLKMVDEKIREYYELNKNESEEN